HSDVVREAQELVELALKGMLRAVGVEPPKFHDVGGLLVEHRLKFAPSVREELARAAEISKRLRRERELALYGDIDFIPTEEYSAADGQRAYDEAAWVLALAQDAIRPLTVAYTVRRRDNEEVIRIISSRQASKKERTFYRQSP